jgi:O-antigen/teichoic acid export membrane protein
MRYKNKIQQVLTKLSLDNLSGNFLKAISGAFLIQVIGMGTAYIFMVVLTRYYGVEAFGLYSLGFVVMNMNSILTRLGIDSSAVKFIPSFGLDKQKINAFYLKGISLVFILSCIISLMLYFSAGFLSEVVFKKDALGIYIQSFAISLIFFSLIEFNAETLRGLGKTNWQVSLKTLLTPLIGLFVVSSAIYFKFEVKIYSLYLFTVGFICILSFIILAKELKITKKDKFFTKKIPLYQDIFKVSFPMFLFGSMLLMSEWVNTIMLGALGTVEDVAIYRVIVRISSLTIIVLTAVNTVLAPKIARLYAEKKLCELKNEIQKSTKLIFWGSLPIQLGLFVSGFFILKLFGNEFTIGLNALYLLLLGQLFNSITGPVGLLLNMTKYQVFLRNVAIVRLILNIILNMILIPYLGVLGTVISNVVGGILINILCVFKSYKELDILVVYVPFIKQVK